MGWGYCLAHLQRPKEKRFIKPVLPFFLSFFFFFFSILGIEPRASQAFYHLRYAPALFFFFSYLIKEIES
jgi:hypothetical protein